MEKSYIKLPLQAFGMGDPTKSGGRLPVVFQCLNKILLRQRRTLTLDSPVAQVAILLRLARLMGEAGVEQGVGFLKLAFVQFHPAQKPQSPGVVWLNNQRPGQVIPAFVACLQPLYMAEAIAVGLPIGKVGLQKQTGNLGLLGLGYLT